MVEKRGLWAAILVLVVSGWARPAGADLFGSTGNEQPEVASRRVLVVADEGRQTLIEDKVIHGKVGRLVHLRPFPSSPTSDRAAPLLFDEMESFLTRRPPHRSAVRARPFGPSLLSRWWGPASPAENDADADAGSEEAPTPLALLERSTFAGSVPTSSVTGVPRWPADFDGFLRRYEVTLSPATAAASARYLNDGWSLIASVWEASPRSERHRLGPVRFDFDTPQPRLTLVHVDRELIDLYLVGSRPLGPLGLGTTRSMTPWQPGPVEPNSAVIVVDARWTAEETLAPPWIRMGLTDNRALDRVTHVLYRPSTESYRDVVFAPVPGPRGEPPRPGTFFDVLMCILLGLLPVFVAPESWILLVLQNWARDRATPVNTPWTTRIWSLWPLGVGVFWFVQMDGWARVAGVLPVMLGLIAARSYDPPHQRFVRVRLEKKKSKTKPS